MNIVRILLLAGFCACSVHAAESPPPAEDASGFTVLLGQWRFLNSSTALCRERVPALKGDVSSAYDHAETQIRKAQAMILEGIGDDRKSYQRYVDLYVQMWNKQADDLVESMKRQDVVKACPVLLGNWQAADAEVILEDWSNFLDRYMSGEAAAGKDQEKR